jgi:hypothetical protein
MEQMIANLFYRRVQPSEVRQMDFTELKYWNEIHELMASEERKPPEGK